MRNVLENVVLFLELREAYNQTVIFKDDKVLVLDVEYEEFTKYSYYQYANHLVEMWLNNEYLETKITELSQDNRVCRIFVEEFLQYRKDLEVFLSVSYVKALEFSGFEDKVDLPELISYLTYCLLESEQGEVDKKYKYECLNHLMELSKLESK
ncbi:MAG: hypothetical protein ACRCZR_01350 [Cetobacterium sp.]